MSSALKRRLTRTQELDKIKEKLRANLPTLDQRQIRRHRIPYHQALYLELIEDGYYGSAEYINKLMKYQDELRSISDKESPIMKQPILRESKETLKILYNGFKAAEVGSLEFQKNIEIDSLLQLGLTFASEDESWWWLADQILLQALQEASDYTLDGEHRHALVRFHYGRFLLNRLKSWEEAAENLKICREISSGHKWLVSDFIKSCRESSNLYKQCCILLNEVLLKEAELYMHDDPFKATKLCQTAVKITIEVQDQQGEARALYKLGLCEMSAGHYKDAVSKFLKVLMINFSTNNFTGICETRIQLALIGLRKNSMRDTKYHLNQLLQFAIKHNLRHYEAAAHKLLGECFLISYLPHDATPHLLTSLEIFHELDEYESREHSKNLAAMASALQLIIRYRMVIVNCGHKNPKIAEESMMKLLRWKDDREIFWEDIVREVTPQPTQPPPSFTSDEIVDEVFEEELEEEEIRSVGLIPEHDVELLMDPDAEFSEQSSEYMEPEN